MNYGGDWVNKNFNFDNVFNALITNFIMTTGEGWVDILWDAVDATEVHQVPRRDNNPWLVILFVIQMFLTALFILNLFVGVVIHTFNVEKDKLSHNNLLTPLQAMVCDVQINIY